MSGEWNRRSMLGALAAAPVAMVAAVASAQSQTAAANPPLTDAGLGKILKGMGLETTLVDKRFDFGYKTNINEEPWEFSMSAVLSQDSESVWIMAWLDELPKSAADVPRSALLRLLADNDKLGNGKFFAYIASNRRFVMQRTMDSEGMTPKLLGDALTDLTHSVVMTQAHWEVENWNLPQQEETSAPTQTGTAAGGSAPQQLPQTKSPAQPGTASAPVRPPVTSAVQDKSGAIRK